MSRNYFAFILETLNFFEIFKYRNHVGQGARMRPVRIMGNIKNTGSPLLSVKSD